MPTKLSFETGPAQLALKESGGVEQAPMISLQLHPTTETKIYASDQSLVDEAKWLMEVTSAAAGPDAPGAEPYTLSYSRIADKAVCTILVTQSPERFGTLMDMFKGDNASEITIEIEGLTEMADYSRTWDTTASPILVVSSVCFEFPLPQDEK